MPDETRADVVAQARSVCDVLRTTLGPFGATKLVIESSGTVTTTASGSAVLERIDIENPTLKLLKQSGADFRDAQGDGSTTMIALVGALLDEADRLGELGLEAPTIERGYRRALELGLDRLETQGRPLSDMGEASVARTALTGTRNPAAKAQMGDYLVEVIDHVREEYGGLAEFDAEQVKVLSRIGGGQAQSELVSGVILDKQPASESMPRSVEGRIALLSSTVDVPKFGSETGRLPMELSIQPESFEDRAAIGDREREAFEAQLEAAIDAGCQFIATEVAVNDRVKTTLANHGVIAIQRVDHEDLVRIARATGASIVPDLDHVDEGSLGTGTVDIRRRAGRDLVYVEGSTDEPVFTLFVRAPDPRATVAFEKSVQAAVAATLSAARDERVVPGGGAIEMALAHSIRDQARTIADREQLAVEAFADALDVVPRTLAENSGLDAWTALIRLNVAHSEGRTSYGIDALVGETTDVLDDEDDPIVEPLALKREVLTAATELAVKLIRIDARLPARKLAPDQAEKAEQVKQEMYEEDQPASAIHADR